ncbi:MAG TPA: TerB family tellurite resistance protein [Candidatus Binatia bacterium]
MYFSPNLGCLLFLLLIAMIGGAPLLVGLARVILFFFVASSLAGLFGSWWLRRRAIPMAAARHERFVFILVHLLVRLAEADGSLDRREVTVIRDFFARELGYSDERLLAIRDLIKAARVSTVSVAELCARLVEEFDLQARFIVVDLLGRVARADGVVSPAEAAILEEVARRLGLDPFLRGFAWHQGFGQHGFGQRAAAPDRSAEALAVLGLKPGASAAEIKQAWRQLSKQNHPDRVTHLGEEFRRVAEERMRRINAAYDTLKAAGMAL